MDDKLRSVCICHSTPETIGDVVIQHRNVRDNCLPSDYMKSPEEALASLITGELGLGGVPAFARCSKDSIVIRVTTSVSTGKDCVEFSGSPQEMELLIEAVRIWKCIKLVSGTLVGGKSNDAVATVAYEDRTLQHSCIATLIYLTLLGVAEEDAHMFTDLEPERLHVLLCMKLAQDQKDTPDNGELLASAG